MLFHHGPFRHRRRGDLNSEQIDLLNRMNFVWNVPEFFWNIRLNELKEFKRIHRHTDVPLDVIDPRYPNLPLWVRRVRSKALTCKHISDLDKLNFKWTPDGVERNKITVNFARQTSSACTTRVTSESNRSYLRNYCASRRKTEILQQNHPTL